MTLFSIIEISDKPFLHLYGDRADAIQSSILISSNAQAGQAMPEGKWEYRRYANGAVALVCADRITRLSVDTFTGVVLQVSPEAISLAVNLQVLHECAQSASVAHQGAFRKMLLALKEALIMDQASILITAYVPQLDVRPPYSAREVTLVPHAEAKAILLMSS